MISDRAIDRLRDAASWPELDARYEVTGVAGYGGMGTVYIARDHVLDRDVAVKVLDIADQKGSRARAAAARSAHPGQARSSRASSPFTTPARSRTAARST